jgi:hypothetical protein
MRSPDERKKACFFCHQKNNKASKEHVYPKWIYELTRKAIPDVVFESQLAGRPPHRGPLLLNKVCEVCNNTWMSQIETAARPILSPAILDFHPLRLGRPEQKIVATWVTKTAMVLEHIGRHKSLVCRVRDSLAISCETREDLIGGFGPDEWRR